MASRRRVDDSDEAEEATALDLRVSSRSAARPDPALVRSAPSPVGHVHAPLPASRRPPPIADDSDDGEDDDATEFMQARSSSAAPPRSVPPVAELVLRVQGRAVPLESSPSLRSSSAGPAAASTAPAAPPMALPSPMPSVSGADGHHRPLPQRTIGNDASSTGTGAVARVTRIQVVNRGALSTDDVEVSARHERLTAASRENDPEATIPPDRSVVVDARLRVSTRVDPRDDETQAATDDADDTQAPSSPAGDIEPVPHRRVPNTAEGDPVLPRPRAARQAVEPDVFDGVLVVDAPADATVTVNGIDRGRGTVRVGDLDRVARHAVRIHCPGFAPWSGSVTLQGKAAAKIRPVLKPRGR